MRDERMEGRGATAADDAEGRAVVPLLRRGWGKDDNGRLVGRKNPITCARML